MEFKEVIKRRKSVRSFQEKEVEPSKLQTILEVVNSAPSAGNLQAYNVFVVREKKKKELLARAALHQEFVAEAPVVLVFCSNPKESSRRYGRRGEKLYSLQDATIAACFAHLACVDLGLSSCWVGAFDDEQVKEILELKELIPVCILPVGYAAEEPFPTPRKKLSQLVKEI